MPPQFQNNFSPTSNPIQSSSISRKPPHGYVFLIIITILLILTGIFGVWYFSNPLPEEETETIAVVNKFADGSTSLTTSWKTYRNDNFGYELNFPKTWVMDNTYSDTNFQIRGDGEKMGGDTYWQNYKWNSNSEDGPTPEPNDHQSLYLIVYRENIDETIDEYFGLKNYPNQVGKIIETKNFMVSNISGRQYVVESLDHPVGVQWITTIFKKDKDFYVFKSPLKSREFHDQILSTFKFISTSTSTSNTSIEYKNTQYGFTFSLPENWRGYSIITNEWEGYDLTKQSPQGQVISEQGPEISIRNPKWTSQKPYQDIPIMILTIAQWDNLQNEKFHIGAAPIGPSELGRNNKYVFVLPARYNYAGVEGIQEVIEILSKNPLHTF